MLCFLLLNGYIYLDTTKLELRAMQTCSHLQIVDIERACQMILHYKHMSPGQITMRH